MRKTDKTTKAWYLIMSKPRQENLAKENLQQQGYEVYLPLVSLTRRRKGRYITVVEPAFSRYILIRLDQDTDNWAPIRSTFGVSGMVYFGFQAAHIPDSLVEALQQRENEEGVLTMSTPKLKHGDKVKVLDGIFEGYEGIFTAKSRKERVTILLEATGKLMHIDIDEHQVGLAS
jgi:transcriptional antiterminator RfaH